ncbi:MAG: hypothetical protein JSW52_08580 [Candidatus Coatesbacteria bacterium]|nr:MAG: hypothetical protein JSW52_08580 [Candidatus Coatesbacteria bacterium]
MEITRVNAEEIAAAVRSGIAEDHPAPFEGLFGDRTAAYESYVVGLSEFGVPPVGLACSDDGDVKAIVAWVDPAPEAGTLEVAAVRIIGLFAAAPDEDKAYYIVKVLDALTARLRQQQREYLIIEINPDDDFVIHILEGSNFVLVNAADVLVAGGRGLSETGPALESTEHGGAFEDFVAEPAAPAVDPYLGDFAVRARRREFVRAAEQGRAYYVVESETRIGALTVGDEPGLPNGTVSVSLVHPWHDARVFAAALTIDAERFVVRVPLAATVLRAELADRGFRPCDVRLTYRKLL